MTTAAHLSASLAGRYTVDRELGEGGMATVYLAHDLKHDRKVALKVLKPELAAVIGAERFLREIKTIASLQHPHILGLIDSGEVDGTAYFVMPFVEGESLRDLLNREKQLSIADATRVATEVSAALDYAHRHGVIHRDIKPENILLHDGSALVADFGIALAATAAGGQRMTQTGMSLGTPHYMSPEQAMGEREITPRSDIYSLGAVLYEMLIGEPPFTGPTAQAIVAKLMTEKPASPSRLRETVPLSLEAAVLTALQKLPADRFASAAAFGEALRHSGSSSGAAASGLVRQPRGRARMIAAGVVCAAIGAIASAVVFRGRSAAAIGNAERSQATYSGRATHPAISPDGRFLAYLEPRCAESATHGGCVTLQVLEVGSARPVEIITGADRLATPRWTHDGLALVVAGTLGGNRTGLFILPRLGGTPRRIADEPASYDTHPTADSVALITLEDTSATLRVVAISTGEQIGSVISVHARPNDIAWSPDGQTIAFASNEAVSVMRRKDGAILSTLGAKSREHVRWSADGRHVLMFRWTAGEDDDFVALDVTADGRLGSDRLIASLVPTLLVGEFDIARATGRVVMASGPEFHDIWSFDLSTPRVEARRMTQGTNWYGSPVLTADGRTMYYLRADPTGNSLYRMVDARETALTSERQVVNAALRLSLDERTVIFESNVDSSRVLVIHDLASGTSRRLARNSSVEVGWLLPGAEEILWSNPILKSLWITNAQGANRRQIQITPAAVLTDASTWSQSSQSGMGSWALAPDARAVAVLAQSKTAAMLARIPLHDGPTQILGRFPLNEGEVGIAGWSRDGLIHIARPGSEAGTTALLAVDASTGAIHPEATLPRSCEPISVSYAPTAHRAACAVIDRRVDIMILDGVRP